MSITFDQIRGPVERVVYIGLGWLVARGYITSAEVANYATLILAIAAAGYGWWQNRPAAIVDSAVAIKGVSVQASTSAPDAVKDMANDPDQPKVTIK